jgi:hypothetical protein
MYCFCVNVHCTTATGCQPIDVSKYINNIKNINVEKKFVIGEPICFMWTNRQTDMTPLLVAILNFAKAPKNSKSNCYIQ